MNNQSLFYEKGSRAVLLFHAFTSNPKDMLSLGRALERADYTVYAPVFSGHGTKEPDDIFDYGIKDWIQDGEDAIQFLKGKGYDDIVVMGLSLGGIVATDLLLNEDVIAGGTFASPVMPNYENNVPENFLAWYEQMKKKQGHSDDEIAGLKTSAEVKLKTIFEDIENQLLEMEPAYSSLEKKVFIGQGDKDDMINKEVSVAFKDALTSADIDFHWYDNAPHVLTTGKIGKELQVDVLTFLSSIDWDGGNYE